MIDIKKWEPFAWGYIHAGRDDIEYRVANGIKTWAEETDLALELSNWFQSPLGSFGRLAVHYERASGIELNEGVYRRNFDACADMSEEEAATVIRDILRTWWHTVA